MYNTTEILGHISQFFVRDQVIPLKALFRMFHLQVSSTYIKFITG